MSCYSPLKGFPVSRTNSGKLDYKITSFQVDHMELVKGKWIKCDTPFVSPASEEVVKEYVLIPCQKCIGCRLDYAKQWANRCMLELPYHESSYFLTLTYSDDNLRFSESFDMETGELRKVPTLVKEDWQLFMKRLRKEYSMKYNNKLRFYMCGEYGEHSFRPHFHAVIFGLKLDDLVPYSRTSQGHILYNSEWLQNIWNLGYVVIGDVTYESCNYTARYVTKKVNEELIEHFKDLNLEPEFTLMSRRPGIGAWYYEDHPEIWNYDHFFLGTENGSLQITPPRYFRKLLEKDNGLSEDYLIRKIHDSLLYDDMQESRLISKTRDTSLDYISQLKVEEQNKLASIKSLRRNYK